MKSFQHTSCFPVLRVIPSPLFWTTRRTKHDRSRMNIRVIWTPVTCSVSSAVVLQIHPAQWSSVRSHWPSTDPSTELLNPFRDVSRILLLRDVVEAICMRIRPYNYLRWLADEWVSALSFPDKSTTNSKTPEGWKAWLAWAEIRTWNRVHAIASTSDCATRVV